MLILQYALPDSKSAFCKPVLNPLILLANFGGVRLLSTYSLQVGQDVTETYLDEEADPAAKLGASFGVWSDYGFSIATSMSGQGYTQNQNP